ncbi:TRAP transporter small permease (plasmid) [Paroceanicella profunda]|uniref:TRAP transporter small permease protein n=1 Tax=Paroceanicella profunda TaxID=2579971 RepID=A0A5B8G351_9RHOB|nr:TRAP transporter small permease [Paroceanicella profunda]QDL94370.1 TRAP transporter small permease [Paroceanicella profunda]
MKYIGQLAVLVASLLLVVLVGTTVASVGMRYIAGAPLQWTEEISGLLMVWIVMIGAIACERDKQHLTIDFIVAVLPRRAEALVGIVVGLASLGLLGAMGWLSWELAGSAKYKSTQILRISWFWLDIALTVGAAGIALFVIAALVRKARIVAGGADTE